MTAAYRYSSFRLQVLVVLLLSLLLVLPAAAADEENSKAGGEKEDLTFSLTDREYEYQIGNRPDPFVPFFTGESTAPEVDPNEIVDVNKELSGMQLFEPGQLTLVALMKVKGQYLAMVEDFKGQGYIIREGTKIGRRGVVKEILPNKVIIEEVAMTRAGRELRSEIVMALRKEGEE